MIHFYYDNYCGKEAKLDDISRGESFNETLNKVDCLDCLMVLKNSLYNSKEKEWYEKVILQIKRVKYNKSFQGIINEL